MNVIGAFLSKPWMLIVSVVLLGAFFFIGFPVMTASFAANTPDGAVFDTEFFYTPGEAIHKASLFDASRRSEFIRAHWTYDLVFPLAYGLFATSAWAFGLRLVAGRSKKPPFGLLLIPLGAVVMDLCENAAVSILLSLVGDAAPGFAIGCAAAAASVATLLKWILVVPAFGVAVCLPVVGAFVSTARLVGRRHGTPR